MITPETIRRACGELGQNTISTADLVKRLVREPAPADYETVKRLAREVRDCHTVGEPITRRGRTIRPTVWHAPRPLCPHCGGSGFARTIESRLAEASPPADAWEVETETHADRVLRMAGEADARAAAEED